MEGRNLWPEEMYDYGNGIDPSTPTTDEYKELDRCLSALDEIQYPNPLDYMDKPDAFSFNFKLFDPWYVDRIPAWPEGSMGLDYYLDKRRWVDVYHRKENGPPVLAFICREGVVVAGQDASPTSVHKFFPFNSHVVGCIAGDVTECERFLGDLQDQVIEGSALDVSKWLVETESSPSLKGLSAIVIAGWHNNNPSLYRLDIDGDGKIHQGILFACGFCSDYGYGVLSIRRFPYMSITTAVKLARIAIPTALAESKFYEGHEVSVVDTSENGKIGDSVEVYCVDHEGVQEVKVVDTIREAEPEAKRRKVDVVAQRNGQQDFC